MDSYTFNVLPATWSFYEMYQAVYQAPAYHLIFEALLILAIIKLLLSKSYTPGKIVLSEEEKDALIEEWTPEPLVPDVPDDHPILLSMKNNVMRGLPGKYCNYGEKRCLNMGTFNFLNFVENSKILEETVKALHHYGVGSCGPRGFYGTSDAHLKLEEDLAKFYGCEECIIYSYGFATIASIIPAYSKRGDIIFCDEGVCFSIQKGIEGSRSHVRYFRHNDMEHLEQLLKEQAEKDKKNPKKSKVTRRFLIAEGLYVNYGDICPLPQLVEMRKKYKVRIFLEESFSFGVLGAHGRGVTEHYGIDIDEVELIAACMENSLATMGGFCVGRRYLIDHQRLAGQGYCFSASQPPMLAIAASQALTIMQNNADYLSQLRDNCELVHRELSSIQGLVITGDPISPVKHLRLSEPTNNFDYDLHTLEMITEECKNYGIAMTVARYLSSAEIRPCLPSIRLTVNRGLVADDINNVLLALMNACSSVIPGRR